MPKSTFLKLPQAKQIQFIETALGMFAERGYGQVSIDQLVQNLGIAKGSIYQYFQNKKDLYLYLVEYANAQKQKFVALQLSNIQGNFFAWFKTMHQLNVEFEAQSPLVSSFLYSISKERHNLALGDLYLIILKQNTTFFERLIKKEQAQGIIREDIDASLIAFGLAQWANGLQDYFHLQGDTLSKLHQAKVLDSLIQLLKEGISTKNE